MRNTRKTQHSSDSSKGLAALSCKQKKPEILRLGVQSAGYDSPEQQKEG